MAEGHAKKEPRPFTAPQRAQAVLAVWTERRRPAEVCRELAITEKVLSHWEQRALSGMFQALEAPTRRETGPALSPKLERLLASRWRARPAGWPGWRSGWPSSRSRRQSRRPRSRSAPARGRTRR